MSATAQYPFSSFPESRAMVINTGLPYVLQAAGGVAYNVPVPTGVGAVAVAGEVNIYYSSNGVPGALSAGLNKTQPLWVINPGGLRVIPANTANLVIYTAQAGNVSLEFYNVVIGP